MEVALRQEGTASLLASCSFTLANKKSVHLAAFCLNVGSRDHMPLRCVEPTPVRQVRRLVVHY